MDKSCVLGVDLGTSSVKIAVFSMELECTFITKEPYNKTGDTPTADEWWASFLRTLGNVSQHCPLGYVSAVSFAGYNALVGVDENLDAVTPVVTYYNNEPLQYIKTRYGSGDARFVFLKSGNPLFSNGLTAPQLVWLQRDRQMYLRCRKFLYSSGFIAARLTGRCVVDRTRASQSLLINPFCDTTRWNDELCGFFHVEQTKLPEILEPWDIAGGVTGQASRITGLKEGVPVVIGAVDSTCAAFGAGLCRPGRLLDIGGSAGGLLSLSDRASPIEDVITTSYLLPGLWVRSGALSAASRLFLWFIRNMAPQWDYKEFIRRVGRAEPFCGGLQFLPYVSGARHPYYSPNTKGHFVNLAMEHTIDDMARAVVEGVALAYKLVLQDIRLRDGPPGEIVTVGGDSQDLIWRQIKSDVLQMPYAVPEVFESSAFGAAVLGARAIGLADDLTGFIEKKVRIVDKTLPNPELKRGYNEKFREFVRLCNALYAEENGRYLKVSPENLS